MSSSAGGPEPAVRRRRRRPWPWRLLKGALLLPAAAWFLFEEIGWRPLAAAIGRLARWGPLARLEARIARMPPKPALLLFLVPVVVLLPVKFGALALMHDGHAAAGIGLLVAAKLVGTAVGGRLYLLLRPQLMRLPRFARAMAGWRLLRRRVRAALRRWADWPRWWTAWRQRWSRWMTSVRRVWSRGR